MNIQIVIDSLTKIFTDILSFIPNLINGLIILIVGFLIAHLVRWTLGTALRRLQFDPLVERTGITGSLRGLGIKTQLSHVIAQTIFALLLISFLITATRLMGLEAVAHLLEQLLTFLPNVIAAIIVFLIGGIIAKFAGDMIATMAIALTYAQRLGRLVQYMISIFVVILALGVLGMDTSILVTALTISIAAFGLALGLALGLGTRNIVQHILAGYYMRQRLPIGQTIILDHLRGEINSVGSVNTIITTTDGTIVIPNNLLLETLLHAPAPQTKDQT